MGQNFTIISSTSGSFNNDTPTFTVSNGNNAKSASLGLYWAWKLSWLTPGLCLKCEENEDMTHIYDCKYLNKKTKEISFDKIFKGNLFQQIKIFRIFQENLRRRNEEKLIITKHLPCDPFVSDPLPSGRNGWNI